MSAVPVAAPPRPRREPDVSPDVTSRSRPLARSAGRDLASLPAVVTIGGIGLILLVQLMLSIVLADGAYQISSLQNQKHEAVLQQHALSETLDLYSSPQHLAANAEALGMVASGNALYLDAASGAVSGTGSTAGGSLLGAGDQVSNVLLTPSMIVGPSATATTATGTTSTGTSSAGTTPTTPTNPTGASQAPTDTGTGGAGQAPQTPGLLPSPTTH